MKEIKDYPPKHDHIWQKTMDLQTEKQAVSYQNIVGVVIHNLWEREVEVRPYKVDELITLDGVTGFIEETLQKAQTMLIREVLKIERSRK